jgi:DNA-binding NarL/FixJ family response regulator
MKNGKVTNVLVVASLPIVAAGIEAAIVKVPGFKIQAKAKNLQAGTDLAEIKPPDFFIVDMASVGCLPSTIGKLHELNPNMRIVVLAAHEELFYVRQVLEAGAIAVLSHNSTTEHLVEALQRACFGETYIDPSLAGKVLYSKQLTSIAQTLLSERELSVVQFVAKGFSNKEIARELVLGVKTIETYRARANAKLGRPRRSALIKLAQERGWLA